MQKHKLTIRSWDQGSVFCPYLGGSVAQYHVYAACISTRRFTSTEFELNWLDQQPMELGDYCPSFHVSPHKVVRPVDAFSVDGDLIVSDRGGIMDGMHPSGVYPSASTPGWVDVYCRPSEGFYLKNAYGEAVIYNNADIRDDSSQGDYPGLYVLTRDSRDKATTMTAQFMMPDGWRAVVVGNVATGTAQYLSDSDWNLAVQKPELIAYNWLNSIWRRYGESGSEGTFTKYSSSPKPVVLPSMPSFDSLITTRDVVSAPWAQLARDAYNNIESGFDGNGIALVGDLVGSTTSARDTLKSLSGLMKARNAKAFFNAVASSYLSFRYGWKLLISDVKSLKQSLQRNEASRFTNTTAQSVSSNGDTTTTLTYQVFYDKYGGILNDMSALEQLTDVLDLQLDLGNIWDLTKYSFVLDWFIDVGSVLESMDGFYNVAYRYDVKAAGQSMKVVKSYQPNGYAGNLKVTAYRRRYDSHAIPPSPLPATHQPRSQSWIDGAALVVQRV